jgi:hypothetical protein
MYTDRIAYIEDSLKTQRRMAGEFLDEGDLEAVSAMHLIILQDEEEIGELQEKLDLLNDDACFEKVFNEQKKTRDEDDR